MKKYEGMFIVKPDMNKDDQGKIVESIKTSITKNGGKVTTSEIWGKRRLAHPIKGCKDGEYHRFEFEIDPKSISDLKQVYKLNEDIIREIIIVKE